MYSRFQRLPPPHTVRRFAQAHAWLPWAQQTVQFWFRSTSSHMATDLNITIVMALILPLYVRGMHVTNKKVCVKIQQEIGPHEDLTIVIASPLVL